MYPIALAIIGDILIGPGYLALNFLGHEEPRSPVRWGGGLRPRPSRAVPAARLPFELHGDILEPVVYSQVLSQLRAAEFLEQ